LKGSTSIPEGRPIHKGDGRKGSVPGSPWGMGRGEVRLIWKKKEGFPMEMTIIPYPLGEREGGSAFHRSQEGNRKIQKHF